jgi:hypothetical protein
MATKTWEAVHGATHGTGATAKAAVLPAHIGNRSIRDTIDAVRVTLAVLVIQIVFRGMLLLRRWNY